MKNIELEKLKYPIGVFVKPEVITADYLENCINDIESFPARLRSTIDNLYGPQLDTAYRPGGWTIRQVVHHCADSHMNSIIRFKLALTEEKPTIKPYWEDRWAELTDSKMPVEPSLLLLEGLHARWALLLRSLKEEDLSRTFVHPEHGKEFRLDENIGVYAWHCNHHLAHITVLKKQKGWQ
jgi:DinB superfamily